MKLNMRRATREDAAVLGQINYDAFKKIADEHGFPPDFATVDDAVGAVTSLASNPGVYSVVAEADGKIAGSNFMDERNPIAGIGPISVDPSVQNQTIGRSLMEDVLARARAISPACAWSRPHTTIARYVFTPSSDSKRANRFRCCRASR